MTSPMSCSTTRMVTPRSRMRDQQPRQLGGLAHVEAGGRLVEEQQVRVGRQGAGQLDGRAAGRRRGSGRPARPGWPTPTTSSASRARRAMATLLAPGRGQVEQAGHEPGAAPHVGADHDVLQRGHAGEEPEVLEGAGHAAGGHLVRRPAVERHALEPHLARVGDGHAGEQVEEGRLAGAVGTDDRLDAPGPDVEAHLPDGLDPAEALGDATDLEQAHGASAPGRGRARDHSALAAPRSSTLRIPSGEKSMTTSRMAANTASS